MFADWPGQNVWREVRAGLGLGAKGWALALELGHIRIEYHHRQVCVFIKSVNHEMNHQLTTFS